MQIAANLAQDLLILSVDRLVAEKGATEDYADLLFSILEEASPCGIGKGGVPRYSWYEYALVIVEKGLGAGGSLEVETEAEGGMDTAHEVPAEAKERQEATVVSTEQKGESSPLDSDFAMLADSPPLAQVALLTTQNFVQHYRRLKSEEKERAERGSGPIAVFNEARATMSDVLRQRVEVTLQRATFVEGELNLVLLLRPRSKKLSLTLCILTALLRKLSSSSQVCE